MEPLPEYVYFRPFPHHQTDIECIRVLGITFEGFYYGVTTHGAHWTVPPESTLDDFEQWVLSVRAAQP